VLWLISFGVKPSTEIRRLRELCEAGVAHRLILGGENFGKYLLTEMQENWLRGGPAGEPIVAEASLVLKEYQ
jgi:hypothetical protein